MSNEVEDNTVIVMPHKLFKGGKRRSDINKKIDRENKAKEKESLAWQLKNPKDLRNRKMSITCKRCHRLVVEIRLVGFNVKDLWIMDAICRKCRTELNPKSTGKHVEDKSQVKIEDMMDLYGDKNDGERKDIPDKVDG